MGKSQVELNEEVLQQYIREIVAINYKAPLTKSDFFSPEMIEEIVEDSDFGYAQETIKTCFLYQSEKPTLFINVPNTSEITSKGSIHFSWGFYDVSFFQEIDEILCDKGVDGIEFLTFPQYVECDQADLFKKKFNFPRYTVVGELIFMYRQGLMLEKWMKESGLFKLADDFRVEIEAHDSCEESNEEFRNFILETLDNSIEEVEL